MMLHVFTILECPLGFLVCIKVYPLFERTFLIPQKGVFLFRDPLIPRPPGKGLVSTQEAAWLSWMLSSRGDRVGFQHHFKVILTLRNSVHHLGDLIAKFCTIAFVNSNKPIVCMDVLVASCTKSPSVEPANLSASVVEKLRFGVIGWLASFPAGNGAAANRVRVAKATHPLQSTLALVCNGNMCRHCWDGRCTRILSSRRGLAIELVDSVTNWARGVV